MHWLPGIIQRFREECPDVDVDIRMADHVDVPYELLAQGKMDAILVSPQDEGQYEWVHLADDPMFAVLPKDFDTQGLAVRSLDAASDGLRHFIDCTKRVVAEMQP